MLPTVHRTLTEPMSGAKVVLEICIHGCIIRIPSRQRQIVIWYGWLPHRTAVVESGNREASRAATQLAHAAAAAGKLELKHAVSPHERMHVSSYHRRGVERFLEVLAHAYKRCKGVPTAGALVRTSLWSK